VHQLSLSEIFLFKVAVIQTCIRKVYGWNFCRGIHYFAPDHGTVPSTFLWSVTPPEISKYDQELLETNFILTVIIRSEEGNN
jgi:hypothetical protein